MIRFSKTFVAVLSAAALAAHPALAALRPCCCVTPAHVGQTGEIGPSIAHSVAVVPQAEVARPCCAAKHERPIEAPVAEPADACGARTSPIGGSVAAGGCCCLIAPPAVPASRDAATQKAEEASSAPVLAVVDALPAAPTARLATQHSDSRPRSGPPLLALYCIWRK